jgi:hypothetical protein
MDAALQLIRRLLVTSFTVNSTLSVPPRCDRYMRSNEDALHNLAYSDITGGKLSRTAIQFAVNLPQSSAAANT